MKSKIELKIYEILGVRIFQKAVFLLEKIIHHKDNQKNINYHFGVDENQENFAKYLYYNAMIHVRNVIIIGLCLLIRGIFFELYYWDIIIVLFGIKDVYCIMLQRYNYIRIQNFADEKRVIIEKMINKKVNKLKSSKYDPVHRTEDLCFIEKMQNAKTSEQIVYIMNEDIDSIDRLYKLLYSKEGNI